MKLIRTMTSIIAAAAVVTASVTAVSADGAETEENGVWGAIAGESSTSYDNLFDVILDEKYSDIWDKYCAAVMGEDGADEAAAALKGSISSTYYGQEAVDRIAETGSAAFDCWYINDAAQFTFNSDMTATVTLTDGTETTHAYEYLGQYNIGDGEVLSWGGVEMDVAFPCDVYKSTDDAGEFTYFFFRDDTMAETYHIEFRYGSDLEELQGYLKGKYAYWLSAGMDAAADLHTIDNCIALFCLENMDFSQRTEESAAQVSDLTGTWDCDLSGWGEEFDGIEYYVTIDENGSGATFMNGEKTSDFSAYMFDSGEKGDNIGTYVAYDLGTGEAEQAEYSLTTDESGSTVLALTNDEGTLYYTKRSADSTAGEISSVSDDAADDKNSNPGTGAEGVSALAAIAICAGTAMAVSVKRRK